MNRRQPVSRDEAIAIFRNSTIAPHADEILATMRPSASLLRDRVRLADCPVGGSRFGGFPDVPPDFEWPIWTRSVKKGLLRRHEVEIATPLDFLVQVDLATLADCATPAALPRTGLLSLFYDCNEMPWDVDACDGTHGAALFYFDESAKLERRPTPENLRAFSACTIRPTASWTVPDEDPIGFDDDADAEAYFEEVACEIHGGEAYTHRMFGYGQWVQGPDEAVESDGADARRLLLQIDTDDDRDSGPGWMWGDAGRLYVTMTDAELAARDFAKARLELQCY